MRSAHVKLLLASMLGVVLVGSPVAARVSAFDDFQTGRAIPRQAPAPAPAAYDRGYRDGVLEGERDARDGRRLNIGRAARNERRGDEYQFGFADGYRAGYDRVRASVGPRVFNDRGAYRRNGGTYQEPAAARGYSDGYQRGVDDQRKHNRYDPVGEKDYREADEGYYKDYGSKDAYKNNYRTGFRQGYEDGYRGSPRR